jgi:hypothetical protein
MADIGQSMVFPYIQSDGGGGGIRDVSHWPEHVTSVRDQIDYMKVQQLWCVH